MSMPFPLFSAPMKLRTFSCFIPLKLYISYSFCQDCLFCHTQHTIFFAPMAEFLRVIHTHTDTRTPCITWMGKIFTATCSLSRCAFHTQPKRPLALISSNCSGFWPRSGEGGVKPGSCRKTSNQSASPVFTKP